MKACDSETSMASRSPVDTIPTSLPLSTTGRWRMCLCDMTAAQSSVRPRDPHVITGAVMTCATVVLAGSRPALITRLKMNNFIVTRAMLIALHGLMLVVPDGNTVYHTPPLFNVIGHNKIGPIPIPVIVVIVGFAIAHVVLQFTRFGRNLYAVGGNRDAALASGVNPGKRIRQVYIIAGGLAAFAGWMLAGRLRSVIPNLGEGMVFEVMAAAVIGGISLQGGRGTMLGAFGGVLLLSAIDAGLNLMVVSEFWIGTIRGLIILIAMLVDAQKVRYTAPAAAATAESAPASASAGG